jgi:hypothetical protein
VFSYLQNHLPLALRSSRTATILAVGTATLAGITWYVLNRPRPTPEEIERERRDLLATMGRITDGTIIDASFEPDDPTHTPRLLIYDYRIAGVTYECAQDVSTLAEYVRDIRTDLPVQVRYDLHNPGNSIVVADSWNGLRLTSAHPYTAESHTQKTEALQSDQSTNPTTD